MRKKEINDLETGTLLKVEASHYTEITWQDLFWQKVVEKLKDMMV